MTARRARRMVPGALAALGIFVLADHRTAAACDTVSKARMLDLVNALRGEQNLSPVAREPALDRAAAAHADELAHRRNLDHMSENGDDLGARAEKAGYAYGLVVENLAFGTEDPAHVVELWLTSDGHRANLLESTVRDTGVGCVHNYWVLVMARPLG